MSRKFTIRVAGARWKPCNIGATLTLFNDSVEAGCVWKADAKQYRSCLFHTKRNRYANHKTMSAAKAYVIKQLAGEGKEKK